MTNFISPWIMLATAFVVLFNWAEIDSDALWNYINILIIIACALGAFALWKRSHVAKAMSRLLAVLALAVALLIIVIEPLGISFSSNIWRTINSLLVIGLPFGAGLLMRRS